MSPPPLPQPPPPYIALLPSALPDARRERQLRRELSALGATLARPSLLWDPRTTHLVLTAPVPCLAWACATASARTVTLVLPSYLPALVAAASPSIDPTPHLLPLHPADPARLPADLAALWAGRIWPPAHLFWRAHPSPPLAAHRVLLLGNLRPRGPAAIAAPSNDILVAILRAAGAQVVHTVHQNPTFAIAAPGLDPARLPALAHALRTDLLCLASAFLLDLICRVSADPAHYVMFEQQRPLCAPLLDIHSCPAFPHQLPISINHLPPPPEPVAPLPPNPAPPKRPRRAPKRASTRLLNHDLKSPFSVQGPDDLSVPTPSRRSKRKAATSVSPAKPVAPSDTPPDVPSNLISPATPAPQPSALTPPREQPVIVSPSTHVQQSSAVTPCPDQSSSQHDLEHRVSTRAATEQRSRRVRKRPRNADFTVKSALTFDSPKKAKSVRRSHPGLPVIVIVDSDNEKNDQSPAPPEIAPVPPKQSKSRNASQQPDNETPKQFRGEFASQRPDKDIHGQADVSTVQTTKETIPVSRVFLSPQAAVSKSPVDKRNDEPPERKQQQSQRRELVQHSIGSSTQKPPQSRSKSCAATDVDILSQADGNLESSRKVVARNSALLKDMDIESVEDGYNFVLGLLGGKPSKRNVDLLIGSSTTHETNGRSQSCSIEAPNTEIEPPADDNADESPVFEDEEPLWFDGGDMPVNGTQMVRPEHTISGDDRLGNDGLSCRIERTQRRERSRQDGGEIFRVPVPKQPVVLSKVLQQKFARVRYGNLLQTSCGIKADDELCQSEVKYVDWILGAERLIGCSPGEMEGPENGSRAAAVRRVCLSLAESDALSRFSSAAGLNDVEILVLTGVCTRLVMANTDFDSTPILFNELLSLREKQSQAGFDSVEVVLTAADLNTVSLRHRAVATIWSVLTQEATNRPSGIWPHFNNACSSRLKNVFSKSTLSGVDHLPALRKTLNWVLESMLMATYVHAIRVDDFEDDRPQMGSGDLKATFPENWDLVCQCLEGFYGESGSLLGKQEAVDDVLKGFLCNIAVHFAQKVWNVNEKVLVACSRAIQFLSKLRNENCFCTNPALFVSKFQTLSTLNFGCEGVVHHLKTPCDCYFFLGWLFATHGNGNVMKRAMGVIRNGSAFTNVSSSSIGFSRAINHHVGLTLTVADSLASANEKGEDLLCRTLTSKCPRLEVVVQRYVSHGKEDDLCWRSTVEAVGTRCRVLHAKGASVHIYTNWLAQSIIGTFHKVKRSGERRPSSVLQREALRVQESVFSNLALLTLKAIGEVTGLLNAKASEGGRDGPSAALLYVEKSEINVLTFVRIASEIVSQMRSSPEEAMSTSKCSLLSALLSVISNEVTLVKSVQNSKINRENNGHVLDGPEQSANRFAFIEDPSVENMLVCVIGNDIFNDECNLAVEMKGSAAQTLSQLMELRGLRKEFRYGDDDKKQIEEMVRRAGLDGTVLKAPGSRNYSVDESSIVRRRVQNRTRIRFWSDAFVGRWASGLMQHSNTRLEECLIRVAIVGVAHLVETPDGEYRMLLGRIVNALGRVRTSGALAGRWLSDLQLLGNDIVEEETTMGGEWILPSSVRWLEKTLTSLAQGCGELQVRTVVEVLEVSVRGWLMHSKDVHTIRDCLLVYSHLLCISAQLHGMRRGGSNAGWLQAWLAPIAQSVQKLQGRSWQGRREELNGTLCWVQEKVMGALGTVEQNGRDLETRVCVVRMLNSFAHGESTLRGFWRSGRVEVETASGLGRSEERRRFERNVREWQKVLFHSAVEDQLLAGGKAGARSYVELGFVVGRLVEALECFGEERNRCAVLVWQARQVYGKVMAGDLAELLTGHARLARLWDRVERLVAVTG